MSKISRGHSKKLQVTHKVRERSGAHGKSLHAVRGIHLRHVRRKVRFKLASGPRIYRELYKVVENLCQAGPNVISEVAHEFIGYFFSLARFPYAFSLSFFLLYNTSPFISTFFVGASCSRSRVPIW